MDVRELYQQVILDHNRRPKNFQLLDGASHRAEGYNPLCGDRIEVYVEMKGDVLTDVSFQGSGCAISKASASLMTEAIKGKSRRHAEELFESFHSMVTARPGEATKKNELGKLAAFDGVREFPARVKCASLSWHVLKAALRCNSETVTTEE
ncbi:MAG: SUF system NifU family Fe-S cluster assembly protein [Gemmatimonadetes bacterium]|nr:SUF system NifU family Fe-S cluster assembly protein [Gemmatimonadota bacterium]